MRTVTAFIKALFTHWVNWTSGLVGVVLWVLGVVAEGQHWEGWTVLSFKLGALLAIVLSVFSIWKEQYDARLRLENKVNGFPIITLAKDGFKAGTF